MKRRNTIRRLGHRNSSRSRRKIKKSNTLYGGADAEPAEPKPKPTQESIDRGLYGYPFLLKPINAGVPITITNYQWVTDEETKKRSREKVSTIKQAEDKVYKIHDQCLGGYIIYYSISESGFIKENDCNLIQITPDILVWDGNVGGDPKFAKWKIGGVE